MDKNSKAFDFKSDRQQYCLVNMAHKGQKCKSDTAAVRILGCFKSREKAIKHSQSMKSNLDIFVQPTHSWFPLTINPITEETAQKVQALTIHKVEEYISASVNEKADVVKQASEEQADARHKRANELWEEGQTLQKALDESCSADNEVCDTVEVVSRQYEIRGQSYAVISIVGEPEMDDEPVINVLRVFETRDDAKDYLRNTCHAEKVVTNCYVVSMYEWCAPVLVFTKKFFDEVESNYTHSQLEEIHQGKRVERKKIEKLLESRGKTMADVDAFMNDLEAKQNDESTTAAESTKDTGAAAVAEDPAAEGPAVTVVVE